MNEAPGRVESLGWIAAMALVVTLAIPWFLWGSDRLLAGFPVWLWWHVGWLLLTALVFRGFARRAWGLGITDGGTVDADGGDRS